MYAHPADPVNHNRVLSFTAEEIESLAIQEHDRWVAERIADGWILGPEVDAVSKTTPDLVPWEELTEVEKDFDRRPIKDIIPLLESIGYWVYRLY